MAIWGRLQTFLTGAALSRASSDAVGPVLEPVRQHAWQRNRNRVLDPETVARLRVQGLVSDDDASKHVARSGLSDNLLAALEHVLQVAPGLADARSLRRRRRITLDELHHVYAKAQIEPPFWDDLDVLLASLLSPAEAAAAVQQGHLANTTEVAPGETILPSVGASVPAVGGQVTAEAPDGGDPSHVPLTQIDLDAGVQARGAGVSFEQLQVLANLSGLPPGAELLLNMWNRELIDEASVDAGIREGHMKTKWAQAFKRLRWNVLGAAEYAGLHLRGWIDAEAMYKGGKLTGHTKEQMDLLYLNRGRPLAPVQAFTAWARGAPHPEGPGYVARAGTFDEEDFLRATQQSDVRTEYGPILWHNRFAYPPLFQLGRLAQAGALKEARVRTILHFERYEQEDIDALVGFWYGGGTAKADPHVVKAGNQLWTALHKSYIAGESDAATVAPDFVALGIPATAHTEIIDLWNREAALVRRQLTPAQIKRAFTHSAVNEATGVPWTRDEALAALVALGYAPLAAGDYLNL